MTSMSATVEPIFENTTVYPLDYKLDAINSSLWPIRDCFRRPVRLSGPMDKRLSQLHLGSLPDASGFFQVRNARGQISIPTTASIVNRDTTDYSFNFGINPSFHLGSNIITFSTGIQETIRRDSLSPIQMDQNLFRCVSTSSFSAWFGERFTRPIETG